MFYKWISMYSWVSTGLGYCWGYNIERTFFLGCCIVYVHYYVYLKMNVPSLSHFLDYFRRIASLIFMHVHYGTSFYPTLFGSKNKSYMRMIWQKDHDDRGMYRLWKIRFFACTKKKPFWKRRETENTLPLQNIHKLTKHTSKISSSLRFIHKTSIQVYMYVAHQHLVFVLRERRRASFFFNDRETYFMK